MRFWPFSSSTSPSGPSAVATGLLAIALGLLAGNLGSIFQMTQTVLGAISGPLIGIFISGICIPWANAKVRRCASALGAAKVPKEIFRTSFSLTVTERFNHNGDPV